MGCVVLGTNEREAAGCSGLHENHRRKLSTARGNSVIYFLCFKASVLQLYIYITIYGQFFMPS